MNVGTKDTVDMCPYAFHKIAVKCPVVAYIVTPFVC